jgi:cysteine desulfurase
MSADADAIDNNRVIYLDNNATTRVAPEVLESMMPYLSELYGNPSSMHTFGGQVGKAVVQAREQIGALIGAQPDELVFTSCGTESDSTAILSALQSFPEKRHIVTTRVEHPAVKNLCESLDSLTGHKHKVTMLKVGSDGTLDLDVEMAAIAKSRGVLFHTDAVQAVGKIAIDLAKTPIDFLSLSGHKLHAPKGIGVLYVRRGTPFVPFVIGGHQEKGRRGGTENVASIVGLGRACALAGEHMEEENSHVRALRDRLENGLLQTIPNSMLNGHVTDRLPNTTNISFEYVEGEAILLHLDRFGICASSGSACTSGSLEPSHVLRAMGVPFTAAHGSIRFSLSVYNTEAEIDFVLEKLPPIIENLRSMSPFWKGEHSGSVGGAGCKCSC